MKNILFLLIICLSVFTSLWSQDSIDGTLAIQTETKKYSLYIPSSYDPGQPQAMMLGLHPLNTNRWDGEAWRDTLIVFAETNSLLLVCPDGGPDGRIDDPIDTAFTSLLIDSVETWYNVDPTEKYIMGFSWGGRTTYTYGLERTSEFKGLLAIGAAVDIGVIQDVVGNAKDENIFIVHGSTDSPNTRYTPILNALVDNGACLESEFLQGIGHTIDFPNRNSILTDAFTWLKSNACVTNSTDDNNLKEATIYPIPNSGSFTIKGMTPNMQLSIYDLNGQPIGVDQSGKSITLKHYQKGIYIVRLTDGSKSKILKLLIE